MNRVLRVREHPENAVKVLDEISGLVMNAATAAGLAMAVKDFLPEESAQLLARSWLTLAAMSAATIGPLITLAK